MAKNWCFEDTFGKYFGDKIRSQFTKREGLNDFLSNETIIQKMREKISKLINEKRAENSKDREKSQKQCTDGNTFYENGDYPNAYRMYSLAIITAPFPSEELANAFVSRSRASLKLENFTTVLDDIRSAFTFGYEMKWELFYQMAVALYHLKKYEESYYYMSQARALAYNSDVNFDEWTRTLTPLIGNGIIDPDYIRMTPYPLKMSKTETFIDDRIERQYDPSKGRFISAKEMIPENSNILLEDAYAWRNECSLLNSQCNNCLKNLYNSSIWPCHGCSEVVYCSIICAQQSWNSFHRYECGCVSVTQFYGSNECISLHCTFKIGFEKALRMYQQKKSIENVNIEQLDTDTIEYLQVNSLLDHAEDYHKYCDPKKLLAILSGGVFLYLLIEEMAIYKANDREEAIDMCQFFMSMIKRMYSNSFAIYEQCYENCEKECRKHKLSIARGAGVAYAASLFNHDCEPNVQWNFIGKTIRMTTLRPIEKGEELTISYGPHYRLMPVVDRWSILKHCYFFNCSCKRCFHQWSDLNTIGCMKCSGPVVSGECLQCSEKDVEFKNKEIIVDKYRKKFKDSIAKVRKNMDIDINLNSLEKSMAVLSFFMYCRSTSLINDKIMALELFRKYNRFSASIDQCIDILTSNMGFKSETLNRILQIFIRIIHKQSKVSSDLRDNKALWNSIVEVLWEVIPYIMLKEAKRLDIEIDWKSLREKLENVKKIKRKQMKELIFQKVFIAKSI